MQMFLNLRRIFGTVRESNVIGYARLNFHLRTLQ